MRNVDRKVYDRYQNYTVHCNRMQGFCQLCKGQSLDLDVHLTSRDAFGCTRDLKVHVSEVVLVTEDVAQDSVLASLLVGDQSHRDATNGALHWDSTIHHGQRSGTYSGHRAGAIRLEDFTDQTNGIWTLLDGG